MATQNPHTLRLVQGGSADTVEAANHSGEKPTDGAALLSRVQKTAYDACIPLNATIEITQRCNLRCLHCYNFDRDGVERPRTGELATEEILALIQDLRRAGCLFLSFTGGELLSHPQLFLFLEEARRQSMAVQLLSNGTLLRPGVVGRLARFPNIAGVSLSLYGATPEVHDHITQIPGSFRRTWEGADRLRKQRMAVRLKFILMNENVHEAAAMMARAQEHNYPFMIDYVVTSRHDGSRSSLGSRVNEEQLKTLLEGPLQNYVPKGRANVEEQTFPCNCARANCAISAQGDVLPCISVPWVAGNIRERSFAEIWQNSPVFQRIRGLQIADYDSCAPCAHKSWCTRSRGAAFTHSGSYTGTDPLVCAAAEIAHTMNPRDASS